MARKKLVDEVKEIIIENEVKADVAEEKKPVKPKKVITEDSIYYPIPNYTGNSFQEALRTIGVDASFASRKKIADENGLNNYLSLGKDNKELLELLVAGKLKKIKLV